MKNESLGFKFCLILGAVGFLAGFIGPIILCPDANQGPLLGIFITGPAGFAAGFLLWVLAKIFSWNLQTQWRLIKAGCALLVLSVVAVALTPKPNWVGWLYTVEVVSCRPASAETENVIADWEIRTAKASRLSPRAGWQDEVRKILKEDQGSLIEVNVISEKNIMKEKPFLKEERTVAYAVTYAQPTTQTFYIAQSCTILPNGHRGSYFVPVGAMHVTAVRNRPWPPQILGDLLVKATLLPVPDYLRHLN